MVFLYRVQALTWPADQAQERCVRTVPTVLGLPVFLQLAQTHVLHPPGNATLNRLAFIYKVKPCLERQNHSQSTFWMVWEKIFTFYLLKTHTDYFGMDLFWFFVYSWHVFAFLLFFLGEHVTGLFSFFFLFLILLLYFLLHVLVNRSAHMQEEKKNKQTGVPWISAGIVCSIVNSETQQTGLSGWQGWGHDTGLSWTTRSHMEPQ